MATPESDIPHVQLENARQYKTEFLRQMYGAAFASASDLADRLSIFDVVSEESNIVGLGFGLKETGGDVTEQVAVRVYVREKMSLSSLESKERVPSAVNGLPVDVVPVEDLVAAAAVRPTACGVSVGHHAIAAGTLGCLVKRWGGQDVYILSNNHVLADCDRGRVGDLILQPGPGDGGSLNDKIAELADFEPIMQGGPRRMDAAIARLLDPSWVTKDIEMLGDIQPPPMQASINQRVLKHGRTTGYTEGEVVGVAEDVNIRFGKQKILFEEQLAVKGVGGRFAALGDSGALVVDDSSKRAVGLFFSVDLGAGGTAFANRIEPVLARFGVEIL